MELIKEAFQALEDIVGTEYITQDPVIGESYNQVWGNKLLFGEKYSTPPAAILLPKTTEEVQNIVKVCNRYGIRFKAFSSGFEFVGTALESEKSIILDLRRMNRILEIDAKNMHAVIEPYVSAYKLQLEAAKHGLFTGRVGVGYSAGVIAVTCCHQEMTHTQISTSGFGRNVLGIEWVLPTGEILRPGTSGSGWYSADGPGFSMRGILRGRSGANGGHGIITKASIKLYPWYGPPEWEVTSETGVLPVHAQIDKVPDGYKVFVISFPTTDDMLDASVEIAHAEITYVLWPGSAEAAGVPPEGNDEEWAEIQQGNPELAELSRNTVTVIIGACSKREMEYREKYLMTIIEKWGGFLPPALNNPRALARVFMFQIWSNGVPSLRSTGDFIASVHGAEGTQGLIRHMYSTEAAAVEPYLKSGVFSQHMSGVTYRPQENLSVGGSGGLGIRYDPFDDSSLEAARKYISEIYDPQGKFRRFGFTSRGAMLQIESINHVNQNWGPIYDNCDVWLRKVKKMLDPNNLADCSSYAPPDYAEGNV